MQDLNELRGNLKTNPDDPASLLEVGRYYLRTGQYRQAINHYSQATACAPRLLPEIMLDYEREIEKDFNKPGPRLSAAGFQIMQGELDQAVLELEETLEIKTGSLETYNALGRIYVKQGRIDEAISLLEQSFRDGVKDVSLSEILASAYLGKGRIDDAIKLYEDVLAHKPGDKHTLRLLGDMYSRQEKYNEAAQRYQAMFSDDPEVATEVIQRLEALLKKLEGNVRIREILAEIYTRSLKPEAAVTTLRQIMALEPAAIEQVIAKLKEILKGYPDHPQAILALAEAWRRQGNFSEAIENYHRLAQRQPDQLAAAISGYREVLEACPEQVLAMNYLAEAFLLENQVEDALRVYETALRFDATAADLVIKKCREILKVQPRILPARLVLGRALLTKGEAQKAVEEAEAIIAADAKFTSAFLLLGEAYFQLKLCAKALDYLKQALLLEPYNPLVQRQYEAARKKEIELEIERLKERMAKDEWKMALHLDLAKLYLKQGRQEEAVRELQVAQKDQARAPFACNLLGCIFRAEGRYDLAAAQFNRALEALPPELAEFGRTVKFNLGSALEAEGSVSKALKIYESILLEDIDFGGLKQRVKYLKTASLNSMRNKMLVMAAAKYDAREIVALWGGELKNSRHSLKENVNVSFGQKYNTSGFDYFIKGMDKAALEEFTLAVQLDANFGAAVNNLAVSLARQGRYNEAKQYLLQATQTAPNSAVLRNNLGAVNLFLGQLDQARAALEKALELDPRCETAGLNLGDLCYHQGEIKQAINLYRQIGSFSPLADLAEDRLRFKIPA